MALKAGDRVLFTMPTTTGVIVEHATLNRILTTTFMRKAPLAHITCDNGATRFVDMDQIVALVGEKPKAPEVFELVPATGEIA